MVFLQSRRSLLCKDLYNLGGLRGRERLNRVVWMWFGALPGAFGLGRAQPQRRGTMNNVDVVSFIYGRICPGMIIFVSCTWIH